MSQAESPLVLLGAGGHAKVLQAAARACGRHILGVCDPQLARNGDTSWQGAPVLGDDDALMALDVTRIELLLGIGPLVGTNSRMVLHRRLAQSGFRFARLVHPSAWVADDAILAEGVQVMAGAVIQPGCTIGKHCVVNTGATVDHDCVLGDDVHVAPGATICGGARIGDGAFIAAGAVIGPGIALGSGAVIGAGAVVLDDVSAGSRVFGIWPPRRRPAIGVQERHAH
jgi:sugar O-acyltransferase (sialic acid O-acetyltransferase NeuD family)